MLMALSLIFVSLTMLVPSVELIIENNATTILHQKVNASELIRFHTEMVSFCNNNALECNKKSFVDFDANGTYSKFLVPEMMTSIMREKIHCYAEGNRYFTLIDEEHSTPAQQIEYNQLYNSINQYSPSYMGIGKFATDNAHSYILLWNGSKLDITSTSVSQKLRVGDIVMVS